ncbi:ETC complex I subunit [Bradyrhizobium sp. CCGB12]|uniref:NADH dehydrogenase ubiquinone Fe-S protein 4 n=1 Tax=Bradyrhizobium sp. CCGB12 TaxID=2949632 RepID=UPI0020B3DEFD|nr:NADH dehydrogenase ubiquinone Fe-S protein 4 [Bradyrhizobium sp. CCGB12]MCP3395527.1 ETC complex I subunit [Bradyrhizobium sp. CCGB12]
MNRACRRARTHHRGGSVSHESGRRRLWKLRFERPSPLRIEPLMGRAEDNAPLAQVELSFPSAEAAIAYAHRQGLECTVLGPPVPELQVVPGIDDDRRTRAGYSNSSEAVQIGDLQSAVTRAQRNPIADWLLS